MIALERRGGRPLCIGHRGAPAVEPENTIASFRAAVAAGVDIVEFDVLALADRALVVAHSHDLYEASHGAAAGTMRSWTLERVRASLPQVPTLDDALVFFAEEAHGIGVHLDLKVRGREREIVEALRRHGVAERSFVSAFDARSTRAVAATRSGVRVGVTIPRTVVGISDDGRGAAFARAGLVALRRAMPLVARRALAIARASALVLHHSVISEIVVARAHVLGAAVVAWTVDDAVELARVDAAGVDAVVTNDPRIFPTLPS